MAYKYDVFLGYTRRGGADKWVREHFHPALEKSLTNEMPRDPIIFVDWCQEAGVSWPENLAAALHESRVMVSVLSPPYFRSPWCFAEWSTMRQRQDMLRNGTRRHPPALTHPVVFADGRHFPLEAQEIMHVNLGDWAVDLPYESYSRCPEYPDFLKAVRKFAENLAYCIDEAPEWQPDWPIMKKVEPMPGVRANIPLLREVRP